MADANARAIAIVGLGAILPDAPTVDQFWRNLLSKRYSIRETPAGRWGAGDYYDPDPAAPDKTYSNIGGWVTDFTFDWKRFRIPPKVAAAMDEGQQWALTASADALADYGYPNRPLDTERTAVILGTAMGGEQHYWTTLRIQLPEMAAALEATDAFGALPAAQRDTIRRQWQAAVDATIPPITEDTMPGELPNIVSGRVANVLNLRGPNFITDAACASSMAALQASIDLLIEGNVDAVLTGGIDRNMGIGSFVKFCKIGALSPTGTRPFGDGADGFVMGEGAAVFLLKRLDDAERDGDRIYAVIRGVGGASDGRGKGITAPNPVGQQLAIARAWENAGLNPASATLIEAHGTSTRVGDVVEVESLATVFGRGPTTSIGLGSVKSNIGHLKAGAGAAGLLKATLALYHKVQPPTLNAAPANPNIDFDLTPFRLLHEAIPWQTANGTPRRAGVSAYGFGGTNFHVVLEEYTPGRLTAVESADPAAVATTSDGPEPATVRPLPPRGILALGAATPAELGQAVAAALARAATGWTPLPALPSAEVLAAPERLLIDFDTAETLTDRLRKATRAFQDESPRTWRALQNMGIFRGRGAPPGKLAFMFPGQGSQYVNMGRELAAFSPIVQRVFDRADAVMLPILGRPLTNHIFVDPDDAAAMAVAQRDLMQTAITQPAMLTLDTAINELLAAYGFEPDMVVGHSLGEYAGLIAAGILPFEQALEASAARGREMSAIDVPDNGKMAAIVAPIEATLAILDQVDGYVVPANLNSQTQCVVGGASAAVDQVVALAEAEGFRAIPLPVSHAFHTDIVAPASRPLRQVLDRMDVRPPRLPLIANVTGGLYPRDVDKIKDLLERQIASPVQWMKGLETLHAAGARYFLEVGPKRALRGFAAERFGSDPDVVTMLSNHPKYGELATFNQALCSLYAAGYGVVGEASADGSSADKASADKPSADVASAEQPVKLRRESADISSRITEESNMAYPPAPPANGRPDTDHLAGVLQQLLSERAPQPDVHSRHDPPTGSIVISGTGLGLPGAGKAIMDPDNARRILHGEQLVDLIPERFRRRMVDKRIERLVKATDGAGSFETIDDPGAVIKLAGRPGSFDLAAEYGVPEKLVAALDVTSQLAMAAGLDALREAGIPLTMTYKMTTTGKQLPERWLLPEPLRDDTGVIFASAFPGGDRFADEFRRYYTYQNRLTQLDLLEKVRRETADPAAQAAIGREAAALRRALADEPYTFDRRFLFRILSMGHSQFAQYIGARGPNTQVNAACASTAQAIAIAEDWIRSGRCRRVIVIAADNVTGDNLMEWVGAGFLAVGAATTEDRVSEAALPFDRRRHGTILGMGACALVVESEDAVRERGMRGIVELLSSETRNSAFHGTRLDVDHISSVMNDLVSSAERRFGIDRRAMAAATVFMSHETFTPARGGSAAAEIAALRETFGAAADQIVIANTKGFTGHPMGVGIEDVIAVKILEHGIVPPVPNLKEHDPELGVLNLSRGGPYPVQFAIHLAAGFGSQISLTLTRRIPGRPNRIDTPARYNAWLDAISGIGRAQTEVAKRVLRIVAERPPERAPQPNPWLPGTGPQLRVAYGAAPAVANLYPRPAAAPPARQAHDIARPPLAPTRAPERPPTPPATPQSAAQPIAVTEIPPVAPVPAAITPAPAPVMPIEEIVPPASADEPAGDPVAAQVLAIVAEQTGYPVDMLDFDLDLEADLGIDTVKQAETFAAIREMFDIPRQENLSLADYPTLEHVIGFVRDSRPDLVAPAAAAPVTTPTPVADTVRDAPAAGAPAADAGDPIAAQVLAIVAEQTGYPVDMLDFDLDLEADLGIDTVKQAETFAAIREMFDIPRQENLSLADYPTLEHVIGFVYAHRPTPAVAPPLPAAVADPSTADTESAGAGFPRRVPVSVPRPPLDACAATGVILDGAAVLIMPDASGVADALTDALAAAGATPIRLDPAADDAALAAAVASHTPAGLYWLPALDAALDGVQDWLDMTHEAWTRAVDARVKKLYTTARALAAANGDAFLVTATRHGGRHGYDAAGATAPLGGGVTGFAKAYRREADNALVKAVDFAVETSAATIAEQLVAETVFDPGCVEVGYVDEARYGVGLVEAAADNASAVTLGPDTVFVVTGAAGGITSAIVEDLARHSAGIFYLLDLTPAPSAEDPAIAIFRQGREALKQHLIAAAREAGERMRPADIERQIMVVERQEAALRVIEAVTEAGGQAHYTSLDLRDGAAVATAIGDVRQKHGRVDVLIHAAGVEISRGLQEKTRSEFDLVFDVKADGFFHLLRATADMPLGAVAAFSSVAGRFGNQGQTDYSAANDLLCRVTSHLRRIQPETRAFVVDWTAWGEIGMATRGSIPTIMAAAGIDMLPPAVGVPVVRQELLAGTAGEIIMAGRLGVMTAPLHANGGIDPTRAAAWLAADGRETALPVRLTAADPYTGWRFEIELDPTTQPFLSDHAPDPGTPWLPGVMAIEAMAEVAAQIAPGQHVVSVDDVVMAGALKFFRSQPRTLTLVAHPRVAGDGLRVDVALQATHRPSRPELPATTKTHFTATVALAPTVPETVVATAATPTAWPIGRRSLYPPFFHGPSYQVVDAAAVADRDAWARWPAAIEPAIMPAGRPLTAPRLVEMCFQAAALWHLETQGQMAFPLGVDRLTVYDAGAARDGLVAHVTTTDSGATFDGLVFAPDGRVVLRLAGYRTVGRPA